MWDKKVHFRHLMLYEFQKQNNATTTSKNICVDRIRHNSFSRFREGDVKLKVSYVQDIHQKLTMTKSMV
jgi:hypothetical protein